MLVKVAVCVETVVRDAETNSISVFGIIEEFRSAGFPAIVPKFSTLIIVEGDETDPNEFTCQVEFTLNGTRFGSGTVNSSFNDSLRSRVMIVANALPLSEVGMFVATWTINGQTVASYRIPVLQTKDSAEDAP